MFKSILLVFVLMLIHTDQISAQGKFQFGPSVGVGISSMHDRTPNDKRMHFHTGILGSYSINKKFKLQPALLLSTKGYRSSFIHADKRVDLTYIDFITTMKYQPLKAFFIGLGAQVGYLNRAKYRFEYDYDLLKSVDIKKITYDFDFGLNGSIGCQFNSGIGLELAIVYGLRDVFNENSNDPVVDSSQFYQTEYIPAQAKGKNTVISVSFYALFGKKEKKTIE